MLKKTRSMYQTRVARRCVPVRISVVDTKWVGGGRAGRREVEDTFEIEDRLKLAGLREGGMLRGRGGGTGGIFVRPRGGGAVPTAGRQLLWSSLAPHPVEEKPLLLKEEEMWGPVRGKLLAPALAPCWNERVERGAMSIQFFLMSPY